MIRVAHAILGFSPQIGGAENQARLLVRNLSKEDIEVTIFTRKYGNDDITIDDSKIPVLRFWKASGFASKELSAFAISIALFRARKNFDVFHVHQCNVLAFFVALVGSVTKRPVVIKIANSGSKFDFFTMKERLFGGIMLKYILHSKSQFVALSEPIARALEINGVSSDRIKIIPNGVAVSDPVLQSPISPSIGFVGRLEAVKRPSIMIGLAQNFPEAKFHLFGDGSLRSKLEEEVSSRGIENLIFHGEVFDIEAIYDSVSFIVLPSLAEGMSNTLLESIVRGKACLVTDLPENKSLFRHSKSIVKYVDSDRESDWCSALIQLMDVPKKDIAYDRDQLIKYYNIRSVVSSYISLYRTLLA